LCKKWKSRIGNAGAVEENGEGRKKQGGKCGRISQIPKARLDPSVKGRTFGSIKWNSPSVRWEA